MPAPRLCLHFDVNETIMVGDPAGGDTFEQSLCKIIAKSAFVRRGADGQSLTWHDFSPLDVRQRSPTSPVPPLLCPWDPPVGCEPVSWTELRQHVKTFVDEGSPGVIYRPLFEQMRDALRWPKGAPKDKRLLHDDGEHQLLLPAFCQLLQQISPSGSLGDRGYSIVLRTFGCDLGRISAAIAAYSEGKHPLFPNATPLPRPVLWSGRYSPQDEFHLLGSGEHDTHPSESRKWEPGGLDDAEAVLTLQAAAISGVRDDYDHWKAAGYLPASGKPLWLTLDDDKWHHIFFDDNIHNRANDSIIALRVRESEGKPFVTASGDHTRQLHGAFLRKVPTWEPIFDHNWFVTQVAACETGRRRILSEGGALWADLRRLVRSAAAIRAAGVAGQDGVDTAAGSPTDAPAGASGNAAGAPVSGCRQCESAAGKRAPVLWQDDLWAVVHKQQPCGVVGHLQLLAKRHFQGPSAFTEREATAIGLVLRRCEHALERATGCDRVYTAALGSPASPHFHVHMVPVYAASGGSAGGQPPIPLTNTPFDAFLQEKLARDGVVGAVADPAKCVAAAAAWVREMEA